MQKQINNRPTDKYKVIEVEEKHLIENTEISEFIARYSKWDENYINFDIVGKLPIFIKSADYFGPFSWNDRFDYKKRIKNQFFDFFNTEKGDFLLDLLTGIYDFWEFHVTYDYDNLICACHNGAAGLSLRKTPLDKDKFNSFIARKIELNKLMTKKWDFDEQTWGNDSLFIEMEHLFLEMTGLSIHDFSHSLILFKPDHLASLIPFELLQKDTLKNKTVLCFSFMDEKGKSTDYSGMDKKTIPNYTEGISYIYSSPETESMKQEVLCCMEEGIDRVFFAQNENHLINFINNEKLLFISSHGYLRNRTNTLIINNKPLDPHLVNEKKSPFFILFLSCLITITGYKGKNILRTFIQNGLMESCFSSFMINDDIAKRFFMSFIKDIKKLPIPFFHYIYTLFCKYEPGLEVFRYYFFHSVAAPDSFINPYRTDK